MIRTIATATWTPRPGNPSAEESGRWCVEVPDIGHIATIERGPWEYQAVADDLRQLLELDGVSVGEVEIGLDVVTAIAPLDNTITTPATHPQQSLIDGLRKLADALEAHPELGVLENSGFYVCATRFVTGSNIGDIVSDEAGSIGLLEMYAKALDLPRGESRHNGSTHHVVAGKFSGLGIRLSHVSDTDGGAS